MIRPFHLAFLLLATLGVLLPAATGAQSGGPYDLTWNSLDGGGAIASSGGSYVLGGTVGQPDAAPMTGGVYQLQGGFWLTGTAIVAVGDDPPDGSPNATPMAFRLHPVHPNPSGGTMTLVFDLPAESRVDVEVFGLRGDLVRTLLTAERPAGRHQVRWDGADGAGRPVPDGVYFARVRAGSARAVTKLVVAR
jgi:hypothetical protein